jgi:hypothetical protein
VSGSTKAQYVSYLSASSWLDANGEPLEGEKWPENGPDSGFCGDSSHGQPTSDSESSSLAAHFALEYGWPKIRLGRSRTVLDPSAGSRRRNPCEVLVAGACAARRGQKVKEEWRQKFL